uniref:Transcription-repair-coupling factor n=1 Tax=uncultured Chloroflexi bacterium HF0500_03M05 TaxID=710737 RepID=E0XY76_9CHLR|nr:transcription-repair coupling factor (superfamily II helicase) [uncultured Chloroflexi bacterium HF0500_03M05]
MNLNALSSLLESVTQFQQLQKSLARTETSARVQVLANAVPFVFATLSRCLRGPMLVVTPRAEDARSLYEQLIIWTGDGDTVLYFPENETLPFERLVSDIETTHQRLRTLSRMIDPKDQPCIVVSSATAVAQKSIGRQVFESSTHTLYKGQHIKFKEMIDLWCRMGYMVEPVADAPGLVSRRGGILDIFPVGSSSPVRIELWGDEIDSIRLFDPTSQRSTSLVDSVTVIPAQEILPDLTERDQLDRLIDSLDMSNCTVTTRDRISNELASLLKGGDTDGLNFYSGFFNRDSLLNFFPLDGVLALYRPSEIDDTTKANDERTYQLRDVKERRGDLPRAFPSSHMLWREVQGMMERIHRRLDITPWGAQELTNQDTYVLPFTSPPEYFGKLEKFVEDANDLANGGHCVVAVTSVPKRMREILNEYGVNANLLQCPDDIPVPGSITVLQVTGMGFNEGYSLSLNGHKLIVFSDTEIFGVAKQRRRAIRRRVARHETILSELNPGDYVVHVEHGIGRFVGTGHIPRDEVDREYLILQYAESDRLYVPMDHLDRVTAYIAPMDRTPTLTRLGTQMWKRTKERVAQSTHEMASELLSLYATREFAEGVAFPSDTPWQIELEDSFPYEETRDQQTAIAEIKTDMEQSRPMDRLVCGDVGYGKTEIALRAAFKAVMAGKQVAVLVPTTVLAQQHYVTFSQRLSAYPVKIEALSRFRTEQEQRQIVEDLTNGKVDICIGTHRLVQKDVKFKDLGLVIVDEEQRFGVVHKERLKQIRHEVEVLTMTATPIPRTLHLSLAGIRDMSTIDTPPEERLPIKTYVSEFSDELVREAIRREIDRQGQVFFLHNRVRNIDYMANYIRAMVPEAEVGIAHGQMPEDQLERSMIDFADGKTDVLVCTTIIESGLDIPNVNTLIINRSDTFGLAQLYQLRGRIGRGVRRAYAYLMIPPSSSLTELAEKRLKTMLAATELGAGFRIAMKDLEIRGAGNILGAQQSGYIYAIGFDLYTKLLGEAVEELRARNTSIGFSDETDESGKWIQEHAGNIGASVTEMPVSVDLGIPANIPQQYISDLPTRLGIYRKLIDVKTIDGLCSIDEELVDRFGQLPWQVRNLLYVVRLRFQADEAGIKSISREDGKIVLRLQDNVGGAGNALQMVMSSGVKVGHTQIHIDLNKLADSWEGPLIETVENLTAFRERLAAQLEVEA